jgi:outer membrane protein OmpA-like peptidoglycan-associated protein
MNSGGNLKRTFSQFAASLALASAFSGQLFARTAAEQVLGRESHASAVQQKEAAMPAAQAETRPVSVVATAKTDSGSMSGAMATGSVDMSPVTTDLFERMGLKAVWEDVEKSRMMVVTLGEESTCFVTNEAELRAEGKEELEQLAGRLKTHSFKSLRVDGHADNRGSASRNKKLSYDRAVAVAHLLAGYGVPAGKFTAVKGWGSSKPLVANDGPEGWSHNRRVEIRIQVAP